MSNSIVSVQDGESKTTSLAIAEGVCVQHKNIMELVRKYSSDLEEFGMVAFETRSKPAGQRGGSDTEFALLNEQQATLLMTYMRNNDVVREFKKRLVKAFYELAKPASQKELSKKDLALMVIQSEEEKEALAHQVEELTPKAEFHDRVSVAPDAISTAKAAKVLGLGRNRFMSWLRQIGWVTRKNEPYQDKITTGYLDVKLGNWNHPDHGLQQSVTTLITGKGLVKLQQLLAEKKTA